jgi:hypothetical protein
MYRWSSHVIIANQIDNDVNQGISCFPVEDYTNNVSQDCRDLFRLAICRPRGGEWFLSARKRLKPIEQGSAQR